MAAAPVHWLGLVPLQSDGVGLPVFPALAALAGLGFIAVFAVQALRRPSTAPVRRREAVDAAPGVAVAPLAAPAPAPIQYKRAPVSIHFPQLKPDYPDVWGVGEAFEIVLRVDDAALAGHRQVPGLTLAVDGETLQPSFERGVASVRRVFKTLGERTLVADLRVRNEPQPRRTQRSVKVVEYRTEIAEVFANFREEASRAITPIRDDATPWEIFDLLTEANRNLPGARLREIISSFEEAKYSNHPVTRATYERMINALLQLERVEL